MEIISSACVRVGACRSIMQYGFAPIEHGRDHSVRKCDSLIRLDDFIDLEGRAEQHSFSLSVVSSPFPHRSEFIKATGSKTPRYIVISGARKCPEK